MRVESWAAVRPDEMAAVFAAEAVRWQQRLDWDTTALWPVLEHARTIAGVPGLVLRDAAGVITGWTYGAARDGELLCGALTAPDADGTARLVDGMLALPEARAAGRLVWFAFADAPGLDATLAGRGFQLDPHDYLTRPLTKVRALRTPGRTWDVRDLDATADLLRAAYPAHDPARPFAPTGQRAEWQRYAADLVLGQGCGRFQPALSVAVPGAAAAVLDAVALVTDLGGGTAHLAQLAVRPGLRGAGLGAALVARLATAAAAAGFARVTLLVGSRNQTARRLYERWGFGACATFVSATCVGAARAVRRESSAA